jgi:hypothetical protein
VLEGPRFIRTVEPSYRHSVIWEPLDWLTPAAHCILHSLCPTAQQSKHICPDPERVVVVAASVVVVEETTVVVVRGRVVVSFPERQHLFLQQP